MKIALYHPWIYLKGGIEKVILETIKRSRHEWTIFTSHYDPKNTYQEFKKYEIRQLGNVPVQRDFLSVIKAGIIILSQKVDIKNYDMVFVHSDGIGDFITFRNHSKPVVCFCHTPLRIFFDEKYKKTYLTNKGLFVRVLLALFSVCFGFIDRLAWRNYNLVLANSEEVARRIEKSNLAPRSKIRVIHPGIDYESLRPSFIYEHYFLVPGRIIWTKNIEIAIKSFVKFLEFCGKDADGFNLVIAGSLHPKNKDYFERLRELSRGKEDRIFFKVNIPDEEYFKLYSNCYAVIFPPLNEDWGIIPLEAMAFAKPVLAVNEGGPKESIINGETGFLCAADPFDFADKMAFFVNNPSLSKNMGAKGREIAKNYDWKKFVTHIDDIVENFTERH